MADFLADHDLVDPSEASLCQRWLLHQTAHDCGLRHSLATIPQPAVPSYAPLATLSSLLEAQAHRPLPVLELQRTYTELWKRLPENAKAGNAPPTAQQLVNHTWKQCKASYSSLIDLYHASSPSPAILDPETGRSASHSKVSNVIRNFRLPLRSNAGERKPVVAISLPNGPLLGMTVLATATYYTAAPVAHGSGVGKEQFKGDVLKSTSDMVLASEADIHRLGLQDPWLAEAGISVLLVHLSEDMDLVLTELGGHSIDFKTLPSPIPNHADDTGIMLFTSGTSGTKKLVPLSIHTVLCGVAMVEKSWGLSPSMRCLNQMPLNHVGGLIRNLFAPILSGGSVICCTAFDPNLFWDCVEDYAPTWYYASPSMHQVILEVGAGRPESVAKSQIRLVCNAAGSLLPSLAMQLWETFSTASAECTVLPSYGMTECMPISSPPLDYGLEKTATSGISVGPEIAILDNRDQLSVPSGEVGRIAVRGAPVFGGYFKANNVLDTSCFTRDGWFDTGDMGYLDQQGYLFITGRSKEVINRGGELISPFEVEEAIVAAAAKPETLIYGRVSKALAFSVAHDTLQEVVGIAVTALEGSLRPCLRGIAESVKSVLSQVKAPVLIVYMEGGLPTNNNKLLRIKLAERLGLPDISDDTPAAGRYFEAICPPPDTPLSKSIECWPLEVSHQRLAALCGEVVPPNYDFHIRQTNLYPELVLALKDHPQDSTMTPANLDTQHLLKRIRSELHGYSTPRKISCMEEPFPRNLYDEVDDMALDKKLHEHDRGSISSDVSPIEATVRRVFAQVLSLSPSKISSASDFFELGGDSMGAGRLLNALRKEYPLRLPINVFFTSPKVHQLASVIDEKLPRGEPSAAAAADPHPTSPHPAFLPGLEETASSTSPLLMLLQLLPLGIVYPMKRGLTWTVFMYMLAFTQSWATNDGIPGRLLNLVVSISAGGVITRVVAPLVAVAIKWLVIGRHRQGLYPMWGSYHTRWWMVQKVVATGGKGAFDLFNWSRVLHLRLLGATVGKNVVVHRGATLGEWDLITLEDNVALEKCIVRPFAAERNASMYLGRIHIGANSSIGLASIVAAGHRLPENTCIGPNSSSWEVDDAAEEGNRDLASNRIPPAHWVLEWLLGMPLLALVRFVGAAPWLASLVALVRHEPDRDSPDMLEAVIRWFASPNRVAFHYVALAAHVAVGPVFLFAAVLTLKKAFDAWCGKVQPGPNDGRSRMDAFRMLWLRTAMPVPQFHQLTALFGTHYNMTSRLARALGAKIGERVYWPGTGPSIQDFDLLDIGDDVVFGSRSHLVTSDGTGSDVVRVKSGAMVADRVTLLPGVELGEKTVMGSGAVTKRNRRYAPETTWVGSKAGDAVRLSTHPPTASSTAPPATTLHRGPAGLSQKCSETQTSLAHMSSINSTSTTLGPKKHLNSEASSLSNVEKGHKSQSSISLDEKKGATVQAHTRTDTAASSSASPTESTSPFGRAFYGGKATYRVWTQFEIFLYSTLVTVIAGVFWNIPSVSAVQIVSRLYRSNNVVVHIFLAQKWWRPLSMYVFMVTLIAGIMALQTILVLAVLIAAKWVLMGRRVPGNYDWDKSSYCQRWQLFLKLESLRRHCYGGHGILGMLTGTHWIVMYFRALGANIGKDCSLFASGSPSLMFTEPDLLTLGDRVCVDDASLVAHINTRGNFDLHPLVVGARSVLRSGSRLLSGARMEEDSCLLEHTLVMAGDVVDAGSTAQGWPAEEFEPERMPTLEVARHWQVKA